MMLRSQPYLPLLHDGILNLSIFMMRFWIRCLMWIWTEVEASYQRGLRSADDRPSMPRKRWPLQLWCPLRQQLRLERRETTGLPPAAAPRSAMPPMATG